MKSNVKNNHFHMNIMSILTFRVIGKFPNTYCFTKAVAEDLVNKSAKELPVSVFRFSIGNSSWQWKWSLVKRTILDGWFFSALAALKEPLKGWVDSKQAITQTLIGIASGIIRVINAKLSANMEIVPIDLTCNCLIASAWDTSSSKKKYVYFNILISTKIKSKHIKYPNFFHLLKS